jgi:hypothetical protein
MEIQHFDAQQLVDIGFDVISNQERAFRLEQYLAQVSREHQPHVLQTALQWMQAQGAQAKVVELVLPGEGFAFGGRHLQQVTRYIVSKDQMYHLQAGIYA